MLQKLSYPFILKVNYGDMLCSSVQSVDEILWCDHSNETSSAVLLHGTICFLVLYKIKLGIFLDFKN